MPPIRHFDTDMIPFSGFLTDTVPLFTQNFRDRANQDHAVKPLGFVQTPQSFYNADIFNLIFFRKDYSERTGLLFPGRQRAER